MDSNGPVAGEKEAPAGPAFYHGHGLGNDYLVFEAAGSGEPGWPVSPSAVRLVCRKGVGPGSDGIVLLSSRHPADGVFRARGFNPDGSEFERSGNGLRVLASHLHRAGLVGREPFAVRLGGLAPVLMTVHEAGGAGRYDVSVEMGRAEVGLTAVGADPNRLDALDRAVHPSGGPVEFVPVSVGNPHAVVFSGFDAIEEIGPFLSTHPAFRSGVNVQLAGVEAPGRLAIRVWERGAGPTSASGTSACAAAAAAVWTGRIEPGPVRVRMDGGTLLVQVATGLDVGLRGPVEEIADGRLTEGCMERLRRLSA